MNKRVLVIVNPRAGVKKSKRDLFEIIDRLSRAGYTVTAQTTTQGGDGSRFVREYGKDHDLIVCCGGDGTLNEVINGVLDSELKIPLGYVPAGTTNDFARTLQLPKKAERCMDLILSGYPHPYDIGQFNDRKFTYIASLGAFTKVSYSTPQKIKNALGHTAYLLEGVKEIGNITPFEAEFTADKETYSGEFLFGSVSNSTSIAGLFKLNKLEVRLDDGEFELMLIRNPKNVTDLHGLLQGLTRGKYDPRYVVFTHAKEFSFKSKTPLPWTLDGESGGEQTEVKISVLPDAINIIM